MRIEIRDEKWDQGKNRNLRVTLYSPQISRWRQVTNGHGSKKWYYSRGQLPRLHLFKIGWWHLNWSPWWFHLWRFINLAVAKWFPGLWKGMRYSLDTLFLSKAGWEECPERGAIRIFSPFVYRTRASKFIHNHLTEAEQIQRKDLGGSRNDFQKVDA